MRAALASPPSRQQVVVGKPIPAPVGGWNAQAPLAAMPPEDAVLLDNWIPRPGYVETRRGYVTQTSGFGQPVQTLFAWRGSSNGADKLFAAAGSSIYDCNMVGRAVGAPVIAGLNSPRWQYVNFANDAGNFLLAFSGADTPLQYNGVSWGDNSITGSAGAITLDPTRLVDAMINKRRVFMAELGTLRVWYLAVDAISGPADLLDLGPVFALGGTLSGMAAWTVDGGQGPDDMAVFVTTEGQVAVYQGIDPSDPDNWSLVGVYTVGKPLGRRCLLQYGAELVLLTVNGVLPLSQAAKFDRSQDSNVALTSKIQNAFAQATQNYQTNFGWEAFLYQNSQLAFYNVPITSLGTSYQFVQNVQTGAWCRFKGVNAFCWAYANGLAYFGSANAVNLWDVGSADGGQPITCDVGTAFNGFGAIHQQKQFTMIRPILRSPTRITPAVDIFTEYRAGVPTNTPTVSSSGNGMIWGSMVWGHMVWGASNTLRLDWASCTGVGYVGSARMRVSLAQAKVDYNLLLEDGHGGFELENGSGVLLLQDTAYPEVVVQLIGFDVMFQTGGML